MLEVRQPRKQDLRDDSAWSITCAEINSRTGDFPGSKYFRAASNSSGVKGPETLLPTGVKTFHRSDGSLLMSLVDSRLPVLCAPFCMSCAAMEFADTGHRREEGLDLPVSY